MRSTGQRRWVDWLGLVLILAGSWQMVGLLLDIRLHLRVFQNLRWTGELGTAVVLVSLRQLLTGVFSIGTGTAAVKRAACTPPLAAGLGGASLGMMILSLRSAGYSLEVTRRALAEPLWDLAYTMAMPVILALILLLGWCGLVGLCLTERRHSEFSSAPSGTSTLTLRLLFAASGLGTAVFLLFVEDLVGPSSG